MRSILKLILRAFILFGFINTLSLSLSNVQVLLGLSGKVPFFYLASIIAVAITGIILSILWWKTDWLIEKMVGNFDENQINFSVSNLELVPLTLHILGMVLILTSLPSVFGIIAYFISVSRLDETLRPPIYTQISPIVTLMAKLILGLLLFFGKNGLTKSIVAVHDFIFEKSSNSDAPSQ